MKILIFGNHTCSNRGDAAIARGTIEVIAQNYPNADIKLMSRFPNSGDILCRWDVVQDPFHTYYSKNRSPIFNKIHKKIMSRYGYWYANKIRNKFGFKWLPDIEPYQQFKAIIDEYDVFIQVGGSFFVDLYGPSQFDAALCLISRGKKFHLVGHSLGPFDNSDYQDLSRFVFSKTTSIYVRESKSMEEVAQFSLPEKTFKECMDCAFAVNPKVQEQLRNRAFFEKLKQDRPLIAITMRNLSPFNSRLGITQREYEKQFIQTCQYLLDKGYAVVGLSTCTAISGYHKDDRIVIHNIHKELNFDPNFITVLDELNDIEFGELASMCELMIGTRLHSTIIAMTFGIPAIAVYYEHKSAGIFDDIGISELSVKIQEMNSPEYFKNIDNLLQSGSYRTTTLQKISRYIAQGKRELLEYLQF